MQRTPPVGGVRVDLGRRRSHGLGDRPLDLGAQPHHGLALLVALGTEAVAVGRDPLLRLRRQLMLAPGQFREPRAHCIGGAVEVARPLLETSFDLLLRLGEGLRQRTRRLLLALDEERAPLVGDAALLVREQRDRVGTGARERSLELRGAVCRLAFDESRETALCVGEPLVDARGALDSTDEEHGRARCDCGDGESRSAQGQVGPEPHVFNNVAAGQRGVAEDGPRKRHAAARQQARQAESVIGMPLSCPTRTTAPPTASSSSRARRSAAG